MKTMNEKAEIVARNLALLADQYGTEGKPNTAQRCLSVRLQLNAQPEVAARLYDLLTSEGGAR